MDFSWSHLNAQVRSFIINNYYNLEEGQGYNYKADLHQLTKAIKFPETFQDNC